MNPEEQKIEEILTKAANEIYDYITEKDIIKAANEYHNKTIYKKAKFELKKLLVEARINEHEIPTDYHISSSESPDYNKGFAAALRQVVASNRNRISTLKQELEKQ